MLDKWLIDLLVDDSKKIIAIYPGRFQPMGKHHAETFRWIQERFGRKNSFIVTSDKVEVPQSPFNFQEKKRIIESYGFDNVVEVKSPYKAEEVTSRYNPETTSVVFIVGQKDAQRLEGGKFILPLTENPVGYLEHTYYLEAPHVVLKVNNKELNGTQIRRTLGDATISEWKRKQLFKEIFGFMKKPIYEMVSNRLISNHELILDFVESNLELIQEVSATLPAGLEVDDGPRGYWGNEKSFRKYNKELAERMGWAVVDYITGKDLGFQYDHYLTDYPDGPVGAVSYFPAGDINSVGAGTQYIELKGNPAYSQWLKHIKRVALRLGFQFVRDMEERKLAVDQSKEEPTKPEPLTQTAKEFDKVQDKAEKKSPVKEDIITENPDKVYDDIPGGRMLVSWPDSDAFSFGYFEGKMLVGFKGATHSSVYNKYKNLFNSYGMDFVDRFDFKYPGRMWIDNNIISFWVYPSKSEIRKIIKDLEKESKIKIWDKGWMIEIYPGKTKISGSDTKNKLIPLEKYQGSKLPPGYDTEHEKSPLLKKKKTVPKGTGSKKKPVGHKKGEVPAQTHARLRQDWWDNEWWKLLFEEIGKDVLQSFDMQDSLNKKLWVDNKLKPNIRKKLLQIAKEFFEGLELKTKLEDITLTGSAANYTWSKFSDIDLHLRIKFEDVGDEEFVRNYVMSKKSLWNDTHDIKIFGFPVEVYVENVGDTHVASGLYSVLNDKWIVEPKKDKVVIDKDDILSKAEGFTSYEDNLKKLLKDKKYDKVLLTIKSLVDKLKRMRQSGLEKGGEYSVENLAFKVLRRSDFIKRIHDLKTQAYDKKMSLPQENLETSEKINTFVSKEYWLELFK